MNDPSKIWMSAEVLLKDWKPSFADLFWMVLGIVKCERHNYPDLPYRQSRKVEDWFVDSINSIDTLLDEGASLQDIASAVRELEERHGISNARRERAEGRRR